jgi:hypothetical protein
MIFRWRANVRWDVTCCLTGSSHRVRAWRRLRLAWFQEGFTVSDGR